MNKKQPSQMKIAICLDGFRHGGTQHAILHMLPHLCKTYKKVYLIVLQQSISDLKIPSNMNLEILRFNSIKLADVLLCRNLFYFFWRSKPDVILASMYRSMVLAAFTKNFKSKLFWMEQNTYFMRTKNQWKLLELLAHRVFKIICISSDVANLTASKISRREKMVTIPNPILIPQAGINQLNRDNDFIFVGRLVKQKNPRLAIESFNSFLKIYNLDARLHIVGDGELLQGLKTMASEFGIMENCIFHGFLHNAEVYSILNRTKTLVSTSVIEGLAMVRLEALVNGNCLVTTNSGGTEQYFQANSDIGVFLAKGNESDLSQKMYNSLDEKYWVPVAIEKRIKVGKDFSPEKISSFYIREFNM
jgi:glycosyltransferase involved in cell wall biosynthesis